MITREPPVEVGKLFRDQYEIQALIGSGGYAYVFRAYDFLYNRPVALKFIDCARRDKKRRAKLEVFGLDEVDHFNVVRMYQAGLMPDDWTFIAMELLQGPSLRGVLDHHGRLRDSEALHLGAQVADGLDAIHKLNVVHRDVKPENILVVATGVPPRSPTNRALVIDLGVAKFQMVEAQTTQRDVIHGTVKYMCPEHLQSADVTPRSDIFALGTVLYEALAGIHPAYINLKTEDIRIILYRQLFEMPPLLSDLVPGVDSFVAQLIQRMIAKDPAHRPADMIAVANALREAERQLLKRAGDAAMAQRNLWVVPAYWMSQSEQPTTARVTALADENGSAARDLGPSSPAASAPPDDAPVEPDGLVEPSSWRELVAELQTPSSIPRVVPANPKQSVPTIRGYSSEVTPLPPRPSRSIFAGLSRHPLFSHVIASGVLVGTMAGVLDGYVDITRPAGAHSARPTPAIVEVAAAPAAPRARAAFQAAPPNTPAQHPPATSHNDLAAAVPVPAAASTPLPTGPARVQPARATRKSATRLIPSAAVPSASASAPWERRWRPPPKGQWRMPSSGLPGDAPTKVPARAIAPPSRKGRTTPTQPSPHITEPLLPLFGPDDIP